MAIIKKTDEYSWVKYVKRRIELKKNWILLISGSTGSGKSWAGISLAHMLDKNFKPEHIIFGFEELMDLIESGEKYPKGTAFVWDEFQIDASSRDWRSITNRLLNSLLTTFRNKYFILIITTPYSDFIDSQARKLIHAEFETKKIDYNKKQTIVKPMLLQYNSRMKKTYHKYLRVEGEYSATPINLWAIPKPPVWLVDEYERKKMEFTTNLNKDIRQQLKSMKQTGDRKPLTQKQEKVMEMLGRGVEIEEIGSEMGITSRMIYAHKNFAEKKGYSVEEYRKNKEKGSKTNK